MTDPEYPPLNTLSIGVRCRCPRCGEGPLLKGYLTIRESCPACGLDYGFAEPADGPAFFGMSAVGVIGMDHGEDAGDGGEVEKGPDGAGQHRDAGERAILLGVGGAIGAGAFALAGGDDDDGDGLLTHGNRATWT